MMLQGRRRSGSLGGERKRTSQEPREGWTGLETVVVLTAMSTALRWCSCLCCQDVVHYITSPIHVANRCWWIVAACVVNRGRPYFAKKQGHVNCSQVLRMQNLWRATPPPGPSPRPSVAFPAPGAVGTLQTDFVRSIAGAGVGGTPRGRGSTRQRRTAVPLSRSTNAFPSGAARTPPTRTRAEPLWRTPLFLRVQVPLCGMVVVWDAVYRATQPHQRAADPPSPADGSSPSMQNRHPRHSS